MKTRRHPAAAVPKAPGLNKKPAVKIPKGRKPKVNVSRKSGSEEEDAGSVDGRPEEQNEPNSETEERNETPTKRARLDSDDLNGSDEENAAQESSEESEAESDCSESEGISRDLLKIQKWYGLKSTVPKKQLERQLAVSKQKSKISRWRTDNTENSKVKLLVYQTLKDYLKAKEFKHLRPFYKDSSEDAAVMMGLCERKPSESSLTKKQFHEVVLTRLAEFTTSKSPVFIWNLICALSLRSVLEQESTKKWEAYALKRDTAFSANETLSSSPTPVARIKELVPKIIEAIDAAGVAENEEAMFTQGTTKARNGTALAIGVVLKSQLKGKKSVDLFKTSTAVYVVDPRIPYIFFHGSKVESEHMKVIMNVLNPQYSQYVKQDYGDHGLESVITACGAPPLNSAILDDLNEVAAKKAEEAAEVEDLKEEPEAVSSLKRKFLCSSLLTGPHGFHKTNRFKMEHVNTVNQSKVSIKFSSKSGNVGKMINRMVAQGSSPVPYLKALSSKSNSAKASYTPVEKPEN